MEIVLGLEVQIVDGGQALLRYRGIGGNRHFPILTGQYAIPLFEGADIGAGIGKAVFRRHLLHGDVRVEEVMHSPLQAEIGIDFGHLLEEPIDDIDGERLIKKWIIPD